MVGVGVNADSDKLVLFGHGLTMPARFDLDHGISLESTAPTHNAEELAIGCGTFADYTAAIVGSGLTSFCIEVREDAGGKSLAAKGWNALWVFHLLSLACQAPCFPLYSRSSGVRPIYHSTNRNIITKPVDELVLATMNQLHWAKNHKSAFDSLISCPKFSAGMRCFGNAHYLPDFDMRVMLLWSGIEGLFSVHGELSHRIASYAALMFDGSDNEKIAYFSEVKKAYKDRSTAVHGGKRDENKMKKAYVISSLILSRLLARCVELGRVPTSDELDRLTVLKTVH